MNSGKRFRKLIHEKKSFALLGTINAYTAMLAKSVGAEAIYLSGGGVANAAFGLPDIALTTLTEVVEEAARITDACDLPLIVDVDTGFGNQKAIQRTVRLLERVGVAGIQIEDQIIEKRCGHLPHKQIVTVQEMKYRLQAALDARNSEDFVIIARTDAYAIEGLAGTLSRAKAYEGVGADVIFPEALPELSAFSSVTQQLAIPVLANCTEFGKTPLYTKAEYESAGVKIILYPLSVFRMMSQAALNTYETILKTGTQQSLLEAMQTREALYKVLGYEGDK